MAFQYRDREGKKPLRRKNQQYNTSDYFIPFPSLNSGAQVFRASIFLL